MSTISDRDLQDLRRETEAAVLAAVKAAAENRVPDSPAAELLTIAETLVLVSGGPSKTPVRVRG